jgi:hypothetical protein
MSTTEAVSDAPRVGRLRNALATPVGLPTSLVTGGLAVVTLWAFSFPGGPSLGRFVELGAAWLILGTYWTVRLVAAVIAGGVARLSHSWMRWTIPATAALISAALVASSAPLLLRFNLSQAALESLADEVMWRRETQRHVNARFYNVRRAEAIDHGARFLLNDCFLDRCGFAYSPKGPPEKIGEDSYHHLEGAWYVWEESW